MKPKLSSKSSLLIYSIAVFLLAFYLPVYASSIKPVFPTKIVVIKKQEIPGLPVRLSIPKIKVNAKLESVGRTPAGDMDAPKGYTNAAWFNLGPRPGEKGSAVIDGHFGWKNNTPSVFDNLKKLNKGDKLYVKDNKGVTITFVVREIRVYGENDDAYFVFNSNDGKAHLNLITCGGIWNKVTKSYSDRVVVFTDKEV